MFVCVRARVFSQTAVVSMVTSYHALAWALGSIILTTVMISMHAPVQFWEALLMLHKLTQPSGSVLTLDILALNWA